MFTFWFITPISLLLKLHFYSLVLLALMFSKYFSILLVGIITQVFDQVHRQERNRFRCAVDVVEDEGEILEYEILSCLVGI